MTVISDFDIKNNTLPTLVGRFYNVGTINFTALDNLMIDWLNFFFNAKRYSSSISFWILQAKAFYFCSKQ